MMKFNDFEVQVDLLYQKFKAYDATQTDRLTKYRNIETESAKFLSILIRTQQSKHVLEIGTSTGYSTLWLAQALQATQGKLQTIEIDEHRSKQAQQYAIQFHLNKMVEFHVGDALVLLQNLTTSFDFILLDAERDQYLKYWPYLTALLNTTGGILVVDNVISHAEQVEAFIQYINEDTRFMATTLNVGAGLLLVTWC